MNTNMFEDAPLEGVVFCKWLSGLGVRMLGLVGGGGEKTETPLQMELLPISNFDFWVVGCVMGGLAALVGGWGVKIQTPPPPLDGSLKHENSNTRTLENLKTRKRENSNTRKLENSFPVYCVSYAPSSQSQDSQFRSQDLQSQVSGIMDCLLLAPGNRVIN